MGPHHRGFLKTYFSALAVLATVILVQPVSTELAFASAPEKTTELREEATAQWQKVLSLTDTETITQGTRIWVSEINGQTSIVLNIDIFHLGAGEADRLIGQLVTNDNIFSMNNNLGRATLSPVQIEICNKDDQNVDGTCNVVLDTVTIQAEWTGIGHVSRDRTVSEPAANTKVVIKTSTGDATATAMVDGVDPGNLISASLSKVVTVTTTS